MINLLVKKTRVKELTLLACRKCKCFLLVIIFLFLNKFLIAQNYYACGNGTMFELNISDCENDECTLSEIGASPSFNYTFCPNGNLYGQWGDDIYQIDQTTGSYSIIFSPNSGLEPEGCACFQDSLFYTLGFADGLLYEYNINAGSVTLLGSTGFVPDEDIAFFEGEFYFPCSNGIVRLDVTNPSNSTLAVTWSLGAYRVLGLTGSSVCHVLIGRDIIGDQLVEINLIDGSITSLCSIPTWLAGIVSIYEYNNFPTCEVYIDLDCNDSSGATEADFNSPDFDCLSNLVPIADEDIKILIDDVITTMTIKLIDPLPDDPNEFLLFNGIVSGISVSGSGTTMITLTNTGGGKIEDFKDALHAIFYNNTTAYPTEGLRIVEVQFYTASGAMSNTASTYIQVNELPIMNVDLGPDVERCEGETATFNAGNAGATYQWSNGQNSQSITVGIEGEYIVTVSDGVSCPNQDTVLLDIIPVIHVSLIGDSEICDNEQATLTISTDADFPLTVEINVNPGPSFTFTNVEGNYNFTDLPNGSTEYIITNVIPSQSACLEIIDSIQEIDVFLSYEHNEEVILCEGDSVFLGYYWETLPGEYEIEFNSIEGCDSVVIFNIEILPAVQILEFSTTCNPSEAGLFITYLNNPNGCDTIKQTTVTLLPADTTYLSSTSCNISSTGIFTQELSNQDGCDSLLITTVSWIPPSDTTIINETTCDSNEVGVFQQLLLNQTGCDSLVILTITEAPADTTHLNGISCDINMIGVSEVLYNDLSGCDSLVITTISTGQPDTTYLNATSCDSSSLGIIVDNFISSSGCDSTVITTISYSASDSTFIQDASCNVADVGIFIEAFINGFGCDSIVTTTISLLPNNESSINTTTCEPDEAGIFVENLTNQFGCDSIVTTTVSLLPSDETSFSSTTCMSAEAGIFTTSHLNQFGCDSIVTLTVSLIPADTTIFSFKTCDPLQVSSLETTYTNQDGCDSLVIEQTTLYPLPQVQIEVTSDFNGYAISCFGEGDGSASADVTGVQPWTYMWSTGSADQSISGLSAGNYAVTVTDANGCIATDEVLLFEPHEFSINFIVSQPDCFSHEDGSITVEQSGGIEPIKYSIDGINYQSSSTFGSLASGTYTITALDANDCEVKEIIWINVPLMVNVELGDDQVLLPGDTVIINAVVNVPFDSLASVSWSGLINANCPMCLEQPVAPIITTTYSVTVTSLDGCMDEDAMTLFLENNIDIYIPNIFSPNGDNVNDRLIINTGSGIKEISSMIIFDRWGNVVFSAEHFQASDILSSWDGRFKGNELNPGVFAYRIIMQFQDGRQEIQYGDITVVR